MSLAIHTTPRKDKSDFMYVHGCTYDFVSFNVPGSIMMSVSSVIIFQPMTLLRKAITCIFNIIRTVLYKLFILYPACIACLPSYVPFYPVMDHLTSCSPTLIFGLARGSKAGSPTVACLPSFENITMTVIKPMIPVNKTIRNFFLTDAGSFLMPLFCCVSLDLQNL